VAKVEAASSVRSHATRIIVPTTTGSCRGDVDLPAIRLQRVRNLSAAGSEGVVRSPRIHDRISFDALIQRAPTRQSARPMPRDAPSHAICAASDGAPRSAGGSYRLLDSFACVPESKGGVHQQLANLAVNVLDVRAVVAAAVRVIRVVGILDFLCVSHAFKRAVHGLPKRGECVGGNRCHPAVGHRSVLSCRASWARYAQQQPTCHSDRFAPSQSGDVYCAVCYTQMLHCATGPGRQLSDGLRPEPLCASVEQQLGNHLGSAQQIGWRC
jgi:hypothetical protein